MAQVSVCVIALDKPLGQHSGTVVCLVALKELKRRQSGIRICVVALNEPLGHHSDTVVCVAALKDL